MRPVTRSGARLLKPSAHHPNSLAWWASTALLVAAGWLLTSHAVTIYDGVGQPDEPYRYVSAPPGAPSTAKPTGAHTTVPVVAGVNSEYISLPSQEKAPQVMAYLPQEGLAARSGTISVDLTPGAPTDQPADGRIDGNVYRLSITNAGPVTFTANGGNPSLILRATTGQIEPVMEYRSGPGQEWRQVTTSRYTNDRFMGSLPSTGEYALVVLRAPAPGTPAATTAVVSGSGSDHREMIIIVLGSLILLLSVVLAVRWRAKEANS